MLPTDMIGLGPDRLQGLIADMTSVLRHRDTGDCSSSFFSLTGSPLMGGQTAYHDRKPSHALAFLLPSRQDDTHFQQVVGDSWHVWYSRIPM